MWSELDVTSPVGEDNFGLLAINAQHDRRPARVRQFCSPDGAAVPGRECCKGSGPISRRRNTTVNSGRISALVPDEQTASLT